MHRCQSAPGRYPPTPRSGRNAFFHRGFVAGIAIDGGPVNHYKSRRPRQTMSSDYLAATIAIIAGVGMALLLTLAAKYLGPSRPTKAKAIPYEAGSDVIGSPRARFSVKSRFCSDPESANSDARMRSFKTNHEWPCPDLTTCSNAPSPSAPG